MPKPAETNLFGLTSNRLRQFSLAVVLLLSTCHPAWSGVIQLIDEGTVQGYVGKVDCTGDITCTRSGLTGTINVVAAAGSGAFDDSSDPVVLNTTTKDVHIGDGAGTLTGKLEIGGDADQPQLVIEGHSTQTDDLLIIQQDDDTELFSVSPSPSIKMLEVADAPADTAGYGQWWVNTATPNEPYFTDDAGNDRALIWSGGAFHDGFSDFVANEHLDWTGVDFLVGTATALTSNEIVVGTSPGGELGGTWGTPTIDDTGITLTSITIGALLGVDSIDATGAVDMDYGSADITDHTFTTDGGTVVIDGNITQDAGTTLFMGGVMDATGAVDMDYGSADITDHTFTSDGGTTIIDGSVTAGGDENYIQFTAGYTADPCTSAGTSEVPDNSIFHNTTANELCWCSNSGVDLRLKDFSTACF